jgi:hypothetical protein
MKGADGVVGLGRDHGGALDLLAGRRNPRPKVPPSQHPRRGLKLGWRIRVRCLVVGRKPKTRDVAFSHGWTRLRTNSSGSPEAGSARGATFQTLALGAIRDPPRDSPLGVTRLAYRLRDKLLRDRGRREQSVRQTLTAVSQPTMHPVPP